MDIEITTRNCVLTERLNKITYAKLEKLDKYFTKSDAKSKVCFKKENKSFITEIMLDYSGKLVRATATGKNFYSTLDSVLPKLEGQIRKYHTRFDKSNKNTAYKDRNIFKESERIEKNDSKVVKEKKFKLKPLTVQEAMAEMELLGHNFYVFREAKTDTIQILYLRNDGDLGLIETQ